MGKQITTVEESLEERRELASLADKISAMLETAKNEKRSLTDDEITTFDALEKEHIERMKQVLLFERAYELQTGVKVTGRTIYENPSANLVSLDGEKQKREQFSEYLRGDMSEREYRDLQGTVSNKGGNTIAPEQFVSELIKEVDNATVFRTLARKMTLTGAQSLGVPTLTSGLNDYEWTPEIGEVPKDENMSFGKRTFQPNQLTKLALISKHLVRNSGISIESLVIEELSKKLAGTLEKNYMTGDGVDKPLGVFTESASGISNTRNVAVGKASQTITYDGIVDAVYKLKSAYRANAKWLINSKVVAELRKLKDTTGRPLWQEGITGDRPSTLLNIPVIESEFAPAELETGKPIGILGDFSKYWIVDSLEFELQVLIEVYANKNQIGYQAGYWGDGQPVMSEAFVRIMAGA